MSRYPGRGERSCWTLETRQLRLEIIVVLLDLRVLVAGVQARGDPVGDDPGAEPARGGARALADDAAAEDQADLVGPANGQVVGGGLAGKDPPADRLVQDLGEGELGLQHRDVVAAAWSAAEYGFGKTAGHL